MILLGAVIGRAAGRSVDALLEAELFAPLGFQNGGRWQGRQVLSESWIRASTDTSRIQAYGLAGLPATYGQLWWGLPGGVIAAAGTGGQWILVVPDRQLVLVATGNINTQDNFVAGVRILYDHVLPTTAP